jgi:hypothetical protein
MYPAHQTSQFGIGWSIGWSVAGIHAYTCPVAGTSAPLAPLLGGLTYLYKLQKIHKLYQIEFVWL